MTHPVRLCGWEAEGDRWDGRPGYVDVAVRTGSEGRRASFRGLHRCGSPWACPECAVLVSAQRTAEVERVLSWAHSEGHLLALMTFTVRHRKEHSLTEVWDAVSSGMAAVTGGRWASESEEAHAVRVVEWREAGAQAAMGLGRAPRGWHQGAVPQRRIGTAEAHGVLGWLRVVEVTVGWHGWHVHSHLIAVLQGGDDAVKRAHSLKESMRAQWERGIGKTGFTATRKHGVDLKVAEGARKRLAEYLAKGAAGEEMAIRVAVNKPGRELAREAGMGALKQGRGGLNRHPFELLADLRRYDLRGESNTLAARADQALWLEWTQASLRRRQFVWSASMRALAGVLTDEEIVLQEEQAEGEVIARIPAAVWPSIRHRALDLLEAAEVSDQALFEWFAREDVPYVLPPPDWGARGEQAS